MKYTKYDKLIDESYPEERKAVYEKLKKELGLPDDDAISATAAKPVPKRTSFENFFKTPARLAACVSAAVAVACVAIMLPFTLNSSSGPQTATTTPTPEDRFCVAATCKEIELKYSLKEYSASNNLSLLYVDWYDKAEIKTSMHVNKENSFDIVFYQEILKHRRGTIVDLYITDLHTHVDRFDEYTKLCKNPYEKYFPQFNHARINCFWGVDAVINGEPYAYKAWFRYGEYIYFLELMYPMTENDIFEVIDSMLA